MNAKTKKVVLFVLIVGCLPALLFLPGCGKKAADKSASENVWRRPLFTKIQTLDNGNMNDVYSLLVASQMYEALYDYHYLKRPFEIISNLAQDLPEVSEDKLTYTIRIKQGVMYQDDPCFPEGRGRELKASDFVFAIKRIANMKFNSQIWSDWNGRVVGLDDFREYTKTCENKFAVDYSHKVEGLRALDDYTFQIKLIQPWPQLIYLLATTKTAPTAKEAVDHYGDEIIYHPVGTGPYMLKAWQRGTQIELERNPNWRGGVYPSEGMPEDVENGLLTDAGKPLPFVDRIIFRVIEEFNPAWLMFKQGQFDWMQTFKDNFNEAVNLETFGASEEMIKREIQLIKYDDPSVFWVGFNMQDPVLGKNKPLRKAISRGIDRQDFIDLFFNGVHQVANGMIHPDIPEYNPDIVNTDYAKYDPEESQTLFKEAEVIYGGPIPPLTICIPGADTWSKQAGQYLQKYFKQMGLDLQVDYMDWPTYLDILNKGKHQLFFSGGSPSMPDAIDSLMSYYSKNFGYGGNHYFYSNPEVDAMYEKLLVMFPGPEKNALCHKMEKMILEDCPAVYLNHRVSTVLIHDWFKNYKPHGFSYNLGKYWRIDTEKRSQYQELLKSLK